MKSLILIALLAALTVCYDAASVLPPYQEETILVEESGQSVTKYYDQGGATHRAIDDYILFYEEFVSIPAIPGVVQERDVFYYGNSTTVINLIQISSLVPLPGNNFIGFHGTYGHVKFTTGPGQGHESWVRFYGTYTDWL